MRLSPVALFRPADRYDGVRPLNIYLLRLLYGLMFFVLGKDAWTHILTHQGPWDPRDAIAWCVWAAFATLAGLGIIRPLKMLPILFLEVFYKVLWLGVVAYPLWSAGKLAGSRRRGPPTPSSGWCCRSWRYPGATPSGPTSTGRSGTPKEGVMLFMGCKPLGSKELGTWATSSRYRRRRILRIQVCPRAPHGPAATPGFPSSRSTTFRDDLSAEQLLCGPGAGGPRVRAQAHRVQEGAGPEGLREPDDVVRQGDRRAARRRRIAAHDDHP